MTIKYGSVAQFGYREAKAERYQEYGSNQTELQLKLIIKYGSVAQFG